MSSQENQAQAPETTTSPVATTAAETKPVPPLPAGEQEEPSSPKTNSATRRLSVLYNKAKKSIATAAEKATDHNKKSSEANEATAEASETPAAPTSDAPAATAAEQPTDKTEKRKSRIFLDNIFNRSKTPKEEAAPAPSEPVAATTTEQAEVTPAEQQEAAAPVPPAKDQPKEAAANVIDQIKRNSILNKFFTKKKEGEASAEEPTPHTKQQLPLPPRRLVSVTGDHVDGHKIAKGCFGVTVMMEPISSTCIKKKSFYAETQPDEQAPATESTSADKTTASQLGRRLTQILKSFPANKHGKKRPAATSEEENATADQPAAPTAATTAAPAVQAAA